MKTLIKEVKPSCCKRTTCQGVLCPQFFSRAAGSKKKERYSALNTLITGNRGK